MGALIIKGAVAAIVAAAIISPIICLIGLIKTRIRKPEYFNIWYKQEYDSEFCRAHLVGAMRRLDNRVLYLVEIHPEDATKMLAWTVPKKELRGAYLLKEGRFYRYAFEEELYD